jgi:hypothetical protein
VVAEARRRLPGGVPWRGRPSGADDPGGRRGRAQRRRALVSGGILLAALSACGALLLAPNRLASVRLGEVALGWWGAAVLGGGALGALALGTRDRPPTRTGGTPWAASLALAVVWGSPALWLGLWPALLADGARGLWPGAAAVVGVAAGALLLGAPGEGPRGWSAAGLAARRWPDRREPRVVLVLAEVGVAVLFAGAQLAAVREAGEAIGHPGGAVALVAIAVLALGLLPARQRLRVAAAGGGAILLAFALAVAMTGVATGSAWSGTWRAVAARPRLAFTAASPWTTEGRAVHGPGGETTLRFTERQRLVFASPGRVLLTSEGDDAATAREVRAGETLEVHAGDRLVLARDLRVRFEAGRRIPDGPDSGIAWAEGAETVEGAALGPRVWALMGLGLTVVLGAIGLVPAGEPPGAARRGLAARLGAALVVAGVALAALGGLQVAWLAPEVYAGGVAGGEVAAALGSTGGVAGGISLAPWVVPAGLAAGAVGALLAGPPAIAVAAIAGRRSTTVAGAAVVLALGAALAARVEAWTLLLAALGLAGAVLAPAALALAWSERATPQGIALGGGLALAAVGALAVAAGVGPASWPAALVAPGHALVLWVARTRRGATGGGVPRGRRALPDGATAAAEPAR